FYLFDIYLYRFYFFFQAEDGIRDRNVTGVQSVLFRSISESKLKSFLNQVPTRTIVVLDEAYYEFVSEENKYDTNNLLNKYPNLIVLRTFSKAYGLAGLRIGYGIMNKEIAHKLNIVRGAFNTTRLAQEAAVIALEDEAFLNKVVSQNTKVKKDFVEFLKNNNF